MLMQQLFIVVTELKLNVFKVKKKSQVNVNVTSFVTKVSMSSRQSSGAAEKSFGQHRERRGDLSLSQLFVTVEKKCFVLFWF